MITRCTARSKATWDRSRSPASSTARSSGSRSWSPSRPIRPRQASWWRRWWRRPSPSRLAELYSEIVGSETRLRHRVERKELRHMIDDSVAVCFGIAFPAIFFILAGADVIELDLAFTLAKWSGLGLIGGYGFIAARLAGQGLAFSLLQAVLVGAIGGVLIAVKALIH